MIMASGGKREGSGHLSNWEHEVALEERLKLKEKRNERDENGKLTKEAKRIIALENIAKIKNPGGKGIDRTFNYRVKLNVLKELEDLYRMISKKGIPKDEMEEYKLKIDLLNKLLPFVAHKKATEAEKVDQGIAPDMTIIKEKKDDDDEKEGDFV